MFKTKLTFEVDGLLDQLVDHGGGVDFDGLALAVVDLVGQVDQGLGSSLHGQFLLQGGDHSLLSHHAQLMGSLDGHLGHVTLGDLGGQGAHFLGVLHRGWRGEGFTFVLVSSQHVFKTYSNNTKCRLIGFFL